MGNMSLEMTSGTWQGTVWRHQILMRGAEKAGGEGGRASCTSPATGPTQGDFLTLGLVAEGTGMPVAMLFDVPNQPLFGGLRGGRSHRAHVPAVPGDGRTPHGLCSSR